MAIIYKIDILNALKAKGYSTYFLRTKKILGEATIQKIRKKNLCLGKTSQRFVNCLTASRVICSNTSKTNRQTIKTQ